MLRPKRCQMAQIPAERYVSAYDDFIEFITSSPTLEQITEYTVSEGVQARLRELRDANRTRRLTDSEEMELDDYVRLDHIVRRAKIRAYKKLETDNCKL
jgi:hypothetical protein